MSRAGLKILCLGDAESTRDGFSRLLEQAGYEVTVAPFVDKKGKPLDGASSFHLVVSGRRRGRGADGRGRPSGPPTMTLRALRDSVRKTQGDVARATKMSQPQLSRLEGRRDHLISTLRKYVRALGGDVEVVALVGGRRVTLRDV
jgi:hypothetical protein